MSFFINKIFYCRDFKFFTAALNAALNKSHFHSCQNAVLNSEETRPDIQTDKTSRPVHTLHRNKIWLVKMIKDNNKILK